ncbi:MAG: tetratricopeptide repeat protein [Elusimicrobiota bacterium]|nr:tetratricopeptide repeat protein [Elusimicrobiota bacterium]
MNYKINKIFRIVTIVISIVTVGFCSYDEIFQEAVNLYKTGNFTSSIEKFMELITVLEEKNLVSAEVWYNIGNCYYRQNKLGYARYCYELAKTIDYYDKDITHNIELLKKITGNTNEDSLFEHIINIFSLRDSFLLLFVFNFLFFASLIMSNFINSPILQWVKRISIIGIFIFLSMSVSRYLSEKKLKGIVVEMTNLLSAPEESTFTKFVPINEGKKVIILAEKDNYYAVYLPNDKLQGWVKKQTVKLINI